MRSWQQYEDLGKNSQEEIAGLETGVSLMSFQGVGEGETKIAKQAGMRENTGDKAREGATNWIV